MKNRLRPFRSFIMIWLLALLLIILPRGPAKADAVTDTLTIRVGYTGMELSEYATVGRYHWTELYQNLQIYSKVYSYYQEGRGDRFTAVVDSANGFYVKDILDYANISYEDIVNLKFYVEDHKGIQASFDRDVLFGKRYYFKDYNYHCRSYDADGNEIRNPDNCWNYCERVEPMLALEDNWSSFTEEMEHAGENFNNMSSGNRFRLLFGQKEPREALTNLSAKYVSCVYLTLEGSPSFGTTSPLEGTYGSHSALLRVNTGHQTIRDALSSLLRIRSSDEGVMIIKDYTVEEDPFYSDIARVTVEYEIVGEGSASILAGIGGIKLESPAGKEAVVVVGNPSDEKEQDPSTEKEKENRTEENKEENKEKEEKKTSSTRKKTATTDSRKKTTTAGSKTSRKQPTKKTTSQSSRDSGPASDTDRQKADASATTQISSEEALLQTPKDSSQVSQADQTAPSTGRIYALSEKVSQELGNTILSDSLPADTPEITEVKVEDLRKEKEQENRKYLMILAVGSLLLLLSGAGFEQISFRLRMRAPKAERS